jgi:hypothetical protein
MKKKSLAVKVNYKEHTGRKKELKDLLQCLQTGQNVAIIAPRRFGKTALITQALKQIKGENISIIYLDLLSNSTTELLSNTLIKETLKNQKLHKEFMAARKDQDSFYTSKGLQTIAAAFPYITRLDDKSLDKWELLNQCMDFPHMLSASLNQKLVCAIDNLGNGIHSDAGGRLAKLIPSKLRQHTRTPHLLAGRNESAFLSLEGIHLIRMGYIENQILIDSLERKFTRLKIKLPPKYADSLVNMTKGHPYYTRLAFEQIMLAYSLENLLPQSKDLMKRLQAAVKNYIEKVWEDLSHNKEHFHTMLALSRGSKNIYQRLQYRKINVARAQKNLEGMGYLMKKESGGYAIADPLLEFWLRKNS